MSTRGALGTCAGLCLALVGVLAACTPTAPPPPDSPRAPDPVVDAAPAALAADAGAAETSASADAAVAEARADAGSTGSDAGPGERFEITLTRSMCYGVCPAYEVTVRNDGTILYVGDKFVNVHGKASDRIDPRDARALADAFDAAGFDGLNMPATCNLVATDHPTFTLSYVHGGRRHVVEHYAGNHCAPPALEKLEDLVDKVASTQRWIACGKGPHPYCSKP